MKPRETAEQIIDRMMASDLKDATEILESALLAERERCAKIADEFPHYIAESIAEAIRSGEK